MINAWHLIWIVPLAATVGFVWGALMASGKEKNHEKAGNPD